MIKDCRIVGYAMGVAVALFASAAEAAVKAITLERDFTSVQLVDSGVGDYRILDCADLGSPIEPAGAPYLPTTTVSFEVAKNVNFLGCSFDAEWETIAENVKLLPIQEPHLLSAKEIPFTEPNADLFASWPREIVEPLGVESAAGKRLLRVRVTPFKYANGKLEAAKKLTVKAEFSNPPKFASVNNRQEASDGGYVKAPGSDQPDYILIAPNAYYSIWEWYVNERKKDHPEVKYAVVNFNKILEDFPINIDNPDKNYYARNDAERLHAYIRQEAKKGTHYFVLAGAWYDGHGCPTGRKATETRKKLTMWTPTTGVVEIGPNNGLPGVYTVPRGDNLFSLNDMPIPSDAFYACCDLPNNAKYPWDEDENGLYLDEEKGKNDLMPDVVVSRMNIRCGATWRADHYTLKYEDVVRGYLEKVRRAEKEDFPGRERYFGAGEKVDGIPTLTHGSTIRDEMEYHTGAFNIFDQRHDRTWTDGSYTGMLLLRDRMGKETPMVEPNFIAQTKWNPKFANRQEAIDEAHRQDWELAFVQSHGSQGGSTAKTFMCEDAQTQKSLMANFVCAFACVMSHPDWTQNGTASTRTDYCSSLIENPDGGAVFTVGNSRYGWGSSCYRGIEEGDGLSACLQLYFIKGIVKDRLSSGDAWLQAMQRYDGRLNPGTARWCWAQVLAFGDPLVYRHQPEDAAIAALTETIALPKSIANDVSVSASRSTTLSIAKPSAAMSLSVSQTANDTFTISGTETFRVATNLVVSAGNLTIAAPGGVGHGGIVFGKKGDLRLEAEERFYPAKITNAGTVTLAGANALLDFRPDALDFERLVLEGKGLETSVGNTLRGTVAGALSKYLPIAVTNQELRLETINAFEGATAEKLFTLKDARLVIGTNPNFGLGYDKTFEAFTKSVEIDNSELKMEGVTAFSFGHASQETKGIEIAVKGNSKFTSSNAGHLGLIGKSRVRLEGGATLAISSEMKDMGNGGLIFEGEGSVSVDNSSALAGDVEIGEGLTVTFKALPLQKVTKLTIKSGAKVILPKNSSGIYQITPLVGSVLEVKENVSFYNGVESEDMKITDATFKSNGSFYDEASLLVWNGANGAKFGESNWKLGSKVEPFNSGRGILFPSFGDSTNRTVNVNGNYLASFAQFANEGTSYLFENGAASARLTLSALAMGGSATFEVPLQVTGSLDVMGGTIRAQSSDASALALNAREAHVYPGAVLGAKSAGETLEQFKFMRFYFLAQKNAANVNNEEGVRLEEIRFYRKNGENYENLLQNNVKTVELKGGNLRNGRLTQLFDGDLGGDAYRPGFNNKSVLIGAPKASMEGGSTYLAIELSSAKPLFDVFGVFAAKYTIGDSTRDGFQPTQMRVEVSADGVNWWKAFEGGDATNVTGTSNPKYMGGWIGSKEDKSFTRTLDPKRPMELELMGGGTLLAEGTYHANITARDGAILKAVDGEALTTDEIAWNFSSSTVKVDTDDIAVSDVAKVILSGTNVTFETLTHFEPIDPKARLVYRDNTISVVSGDGYAGPYTRQLNGTESWNAPKGWDWTKTDDEGVRVPQQFEKAWSDQKLAENVDIEIDLAGDAVLELDTDVICDMFKASETNVVSSFAFRIADAGGKLTAQTLDFSGFSGEVTYEPDCGEARVVAGPLTRLTGGGKGTLFVDAEMTAVLTKPWEGTIEGTGTIVLAPEDGVWTDLSVLKLTTPSMIKLEHATMKIPEGTEILAQKLVVGVGGKIETVPEAGSWVLAGKTVEIQKGGRLEISMANANFANNLNFANFSGSGKLVYVSKSSEIVDIPNKAYPSSLELVLSGGKFAAESYLVRHIRFTFLEPNGGRAELLRVKAYGADNTDIDLTRGTRQAVGFSEGELVSRGNLPEELLLLMGLVSPTSLSPAADGSRYLDVRLTTPIPLFAKFGVINAQNKNPLTAMEVSVSYDGVNYVSVGRMTGISYGGSRVLKTAAATLPAKTDVPGVTVEHGAQLVYREGGKVVEDRVARVPMVIFR